MYCRRYQLLCQERTEERANFRRRFPHRNGRKGAPFPPGLAEIASFSKWIEEDVQNALHKGLDISKDVQDSSRLPSLEARSFRSMYSYGYHFRVKSGETSSTSTCDLGVAAVFRQPCRSGRRDQHVVNADLEYIGQIVEILELNYGRYYIVILVCDWVKANYRGRNATIKKDEWRFTLANFRLVVPFGYESLAFPIHCQQVFFSDDEDECGWIVVLRTEVRGRRIHSAAEEEEDSEMFAMGRDVDFHGLQVPNEMPEPIPDHFPEGREINVNEVLHDPGGEDAMFFDRDLGESSEDD